MKKWVDYQLKNQVKEWDWDYAQHPTANLADKLAPHFAYIEQGFKDETLPAFFENVFTNNRTGPYIAYVSDIEVYNNEFLSPSSYSGSFLNIGQYDYSTQNYV